MKKWIVSALMISAVVGSASAEILISWDAEGVADRTNTTLGVSGRVVSAMASAQGSNDGWFGPDSTALGGFSGASTDAGTFKINGTNNTVTLTINNIAGDGKVLSLSTLVFDYGPKWSTLGSTKLTLSYVSGSLGDSADGSGNLADDTVLSTIDYISQTGNGLSDYSDFSVDLTALLADFKLADGETAKFRLEGSDPLITGDTYVDNIAFTGTTVIPEPATLGLVASVSGGILFIRRRFCM
jgi:hypothetical protein